MPALRSRKPLTRNPTPREIREACEAIRKRWTPSERLSRLVTPPAPAAPPVVNTGQIGAERDYWGEGLAYE